MPERDGSQEGDGPADSTYRPRRRVPEISVVIPARDEADNIGPLLADVRAALDDRVDYEIIVVDDGSVDATPARLQEATRAFPRLRSVRHRAPYGQSASLWTGVRLARAPWIVTLDGDGQNDPADIPALLAARDADHSGRLLLINGYRRSRQDSRVKRASSRIANAVRRTVLGDGTPDTGCGLKVFSRHAFLELPEFNHMHRFIPALMRRSGGVILSVPVRHRERVHGRSHYGVGNRLWTGIVDMLGVLWLQRRATHPELAKGGSASATDEAHLPTAREEER
jgi:dolichol-phosphate mannosyltransferase